MIFFLWWCWLNFWFWSAFCSNIFSSVMNCCIMCQFIRPIMKTLQWVAQCNSYFILCHHGWLYSSSYVSPQFRPSLNFTKHRPVGKSYRINTVVLYLLERKTKTTTYASRQWANNSHATCPTSSYLRINAVCDL